ncbi:MAG: 16S rRNA (cytosine(1402)-N(4))-methyltransferase RsmH [Bacteroidota bacterium]
MNPGDEQPVDQPPFGHEPVLVSEVLDLLISDGAATAQTYCDATIGLGGHGRAILERSGPKGRLIGLDRDADALAVARNTLQPFGDRVTLVHAPFSRVRSVLEGLGAVPLDGFLVDLGVSSPQLDRSERGFSFQREGPLDMRMDQSAGETAAELLARIDEGQLARLLRDFGEERFAGRIARHIIEARDQGKLDSTATLAAIVARAVPGRERHKNPATRTFQALRIAVNEELDELDTFLNQAAACLRPGGRLCVIAFHSLEDRMVKRRFRAMADPAAAGPRVRVLTKRIVVASEDEQARNPRSRSAKLRAAERLA